MIREARPADIAGMLLSGHALLYGRREMDDWAGLVFYLAILRSRLGKEV